MAITSTLERTPPPLPGKTVDNTLPTVGGNLAVVTDSETSSGFSLSWTKGSDDQTAEAQLRYLVYISAQNNITGVQNAENNGTLLNPDEADQLDINTYQVTGQSSETQYWATVILKDQAGNKAAYGVVTTTTAAAGSDGLNSKAGDEAALEALYVALDSPALTGWASSGMDLNNTIEGITVDSINTELRVTEIDLRNKGLTGNINVSEFQNLKEMTLFACYLNSLNSQIPQELMDLVKLKHCYLCLSDSTETDAATVYPHESVQSGGGDYHVGKNKGNEQNVFTGPVPAPSNPSAMTLEWFILNWTDSAEDATDGISSVSSELFDITTMVGMMVYNNNGVADLPFPSGLTNMSNIEIWKVGIEKSGDETGFLTGTVPAGVGQLANLRIFDVSENPNLTVDFDQLDLSGMTSLRNIGASFVELTGAFPPSFLDGTLDTNLVRITLMWPQNGTGMTGTLPSGSTNMQAVLLNNNDLEGDIPTAFWNNVKMINTDFSYNNFTGIGTDDLTALGQDDFWKIRNLRWNQNNVSGRIPNLAWEQPKDNLRDLSRVLWSGNKYVFSDFLWIPSTHNASNKPCFELYADFYDAANNFDEFTYGSQVAGTANGYTVTAGSNLTISDFSTVFTHADNVYQWQKSTDGGSSWSNLSNGGDISGADTNELTIANLDSSDDATYRLSVTNTTFDSIIANSSLSAGLTIVSESITLTVE